MSAIAYSDIFSKFAHYKIVTTMEFVSAISLIWAVLNIILFFKLWGACNNIKRIADKYDPEGKAERERVKRLSPFESREEIDNCLKENK